MCDYGWDGYDVGIQLREEQRRRMAEKGENPVKQASQEPDQQNKTTEERVEKQTVETTEKQSGDFVKGTIQPDKQG